MSRKRYSDVEAKMPKVNDEVKEEEGRKKVEAVAKPLPPRKKTLMERIFIGIVGPDGLVGIGRYLGREIVLPAVKDIVASSLTSGINMAIYGHDRPVGRGRHRSSSNKTGYSRVDYRSYSDDYDRGPRRPPSRDVNRRNDVGYYELESRDDARKVLEVLLDQAKMYDYATVADYYDAIGVDTEFTHNDFGWSYDDLLRVNVLSAGRQKWIIDLPKPVELR